MKNLITYDEFGAEVSLFSNVVNYCYNEPGWFVSVIKGFINELYNEDELIHRLAQNIVYDEMIRRYVFGTVEISNGYRDYRVKINVELLPYDENDCELRMWYVGLYECEYTGDEVFKSPGSDTVVIIRTFADLIDELDKYVEFTKVRLGLNRDE